MNLIFRNPGPQRSTPEFASNSDFNFAGAVESLGSSYRTAKPFPHLIIDGLFSNQILERLVDEMKSLPPKSWVHHSEERQEKYNLRSAVELGEAGRQLTGVLHSAAFLYSLSEITGVWNLLPDPYLEGGGYHVLPRGGYFDVHVDRNTAYITSLKRRLALIVYLNKSWRHEFGGQLELWRTDRTGPEVVVEPILNRTIIFEIADTNLHGVPAKVSCPEGESRNSFAVYYHTIGIDAKTDARPHSSIYLPDGYQRREPISISLMKEITPPIVWRGLRKFRDTAKKNR